MVNYIKNKEETLQFLERADGSFNVYMLPNHPFKSSLVGTGYIKGGIVRSMVNLSYDSRISQNVIILEKRRY